MRATRRLLTRQEQGEVRPPLQKPHRVAIMRASCVRVGLCFYVVRERLAYACSFFFFFQARARSFVCLVFC